eukprot:Ihof_evm2s8 gene=Ihof_evmTU2s8
MEGNDKRRTSLPKLCLNTNGKEPNDIGRTPSPSGMVISQAPMGMYNSAVPDYEPASANRNCPNPFEETFTKHNQQRNLIRNLKSGNDSMDKNGEHRYESGERQDQSTVSSMSASLNSKQNARVGGTTLASSILPVPKNNLTSANLPFDQHFLTNPSNHINLDHASPHTLLDNNRHVQAENRKTYILPNKEGENKNKDSAPSGGPISNFSGLLPYIPPPNDKISSPQEANEEMNEFKGIQPIPGTSGSNSDSGPTTTYTFSNGISPNLYNSGNLSISHSKNYHSKEGKKPITTHPSNRNLGIKRPVYVMDWFDDCSGSAPKIAPKGVPIGDSQSRGRGRGRATWRLTPPESGQVDTDKKSDSNVATSSYGMDSKPTISSASCTFNDPVEESRKRNRAAATRCRQKKKVQMVELERRANDLSKENEELVTTIHAL